MRLDRLLAEEQLGRDLRVRPAVDYQARDLELALGQQLDAGGAGLAGARATVQVAVAEPAQLALGFVAARPRTAALERGADRRSTPHGSADLPAVRR